MAIQDEDFQKRLNEALGMFGQAPTDMPVQTVDPVRAERLAFEASQGAPVASIASIAPTASVAPDNDPRLQAMIANQNALRENTLAQQAQAAETAKTIAQRPRQRFLNEGQGFMDAFKNPGAGQRQFAINAGLSLLSSGGTQDLSQRIGHALGSGVQGMQQARQGEIDSAAKVAQAQQAILTGQAGIIKQDMSFDDQRAAYKAKQLGAAAAAEQKVYDRSLDFQKQGNVEAAAATKKTIRIANEVRADRVREEDRVIDAQKREEDLEYRGGVEERLGSQFSTTELRLGEEKPSSQLQTINEIATLRENGETDKANLLQAYYNKQTALSSTVRTVDPNTGEIRFETSSKIPKYTGGGNTGELPVDAASFAKQSSKSDAQTLAAMRDKYIASAQGQVSLRSFEDTLDQGLRTGGGLTAAAAKGQSILTDIMELSGTGIPGLSKDAEIAAKVQTSLREDAISISSGMGAERLEMFGGNDSERELLVALAMVPGVDKSVAGNRRIIKNSKIAAGILRSKYGFFTDWQRSNGTLSAVNEEGQSVAEAWSKYQMDEFDRLGGDLKDESLRESDFALSNSRVQSYLSRNGYDSGTSEDAYKNKSSPVEQATGNSVLSANVRDLINNTRQR